MDPSSAPLLGLLRTRMSWLAQRQRVLAENIANADTPGYRPFDLKPQPGRAAAAGALAEPTLARTHRDHIAAGPDGRAFAEARQRRSDEVAPAGNAVILDEQMAKLNETAVEHRLATQLYRKYLGFLRTAASAKG